MSTYLHLILDIKTLKQSLDTGYVRRQVHPTEPLAILNYTEKTVFEREWNTVTRNCRGLIYNIDTNEVVARGFPKFFNYGEPDAAAIDLAEQVSVTNKMDGSLGIRYWQPDAKKWAIATRGSFASEQALHATARLQEIYDARDDSYELDTANPYTELFEIVYPDNRIVLDYGDLDDLVYIGAVDTVTGQVLSADSIDLAWTAAYGHRCTTVFPDMTFAEALAMPPRPNAEGIVITAWDGKRMLKVKQEDYVRLHRIISGLSVKSVWEMMRDDLDVRDIQRDLPEEFWPWIAETYNELAWQFCAVRYGAQITHLQILSELADPGDRKEYALRAQKFPYKGLLFKLLDNHDVDDVVFKMIKPKGEQNRPFARGEDVA